MKLYTTPEQAAKLIELGFEKPKSIVGHDGYWGYDYAYSIGELISFCPRRIGNWDLSISCDYAFERWICYLNPESQFGVATELVDALFNLLIKLKEEL